MALRRPHEEVVENHDVIVRRMHQLNFPALVARRPMLPSRYLNDTWTHALSTESEQRWKDALVYKQIDVENIVKILNVTKVDHTLSSDFDWYVLRELNTTQLVRFLARRCPVMCYFGSRYLCEMREEPTGVLLEMFNRMCFMDDSTFDGFLHSAHTFIDRFEEQLFDEYLQSGRMWAIDRWETIAGVNYPTQPPELQFPIVNVYSASELEDPADKLRFIFENDRQCVDFIANELYYEPLAYTLELVGEGTAERYNELRKYVKSDLFNYTGALGERRRVSINHLYDSSAYGALRSEFKRWYETFGVVDLTYLIGKGYHLPDAEAIKTRFEFRLHRFQQELDRFPYNDERIEMTKSDLHFDWMLQKAIEENDETAV